MIVQENLGSLGCRAYSNHTMKRRPGTESQANSLKIAPRSRYLAMRVPACAPFRTLRSFEGEQHVT